MQTPSNNTSKHAGLTFEPNILKTWRPRSIPACSLFASLLERRLKPLFQSNRRWASSTLKPQEHHLSILRQISEQTNERPLYPDQPTNAYVKHPDGHSGWNMLAWVPEKHGGLLGKACPTCGYRYGSAWLKEEIPADVRAAIEAFLSNEAQHA